MVNRFPYMVRFMNPSRLRSQPPRGPLAPHLHPWRKDVASTSEMSQCGSWCCEVRNTLFNGETKAWKSGSGRLTKHLTSIKNRSAAERWGGGGIAFGNIAYVFVICIPDLVVAAIEIGCTNTPPPLYFTPQALSNQHMQTPHLVYTR